MNKNMWPRAQQQYIAPLKTGVEFLVLVYKLVLRKRKLLLSFFVNICQTYILYRLYFKKVKPHLNCAMHNCSKVQNLQIFICIGTKGGI